MLKGQTKYDESYIKTILELYSNGKSVSELSREYGISRNAIYNWIKDYKEIKTDDGDITNNKEIRQLKKELNQTKEELEILKKAIAIFTRK